MTSWKLKQEEKAPSKSTRGELPKKKYRVQKQKEAELDEEAKETMHDINSGGASGKTGANNG